MADKKFSQLPADAAPTTNDIIPTVDSDTNLTKRITIADLIAATFANATPAQIAAALSGISLSENWLINGGFDFWQRNTTFTPNDDTYIADRWNNLSEANASWTFARDTDVPSVGGSKYSLKATNVTLNNQCGIVQFLEGRDAKRLAGKTVSLSFYAKTNGTEIGNLRAALLAWTGTEDSLTSDVVSAWAQNGTNPTWAANYTIENTPSNLALTSSWQRFTIENVLLDTSGLNNLAIVIWVDDGTIAAGDDFYIAQVQLNEGPEAQAYQVRPAAEEFQMCQRYYEKSYLPEVAPGTATSVGSFRFATNSNANNVEIVYPVAFCTPKRINSWSGTFWDTSGNVSRVDTNVAVAGGTYFSLTAVWGWVVDALFNTGTNRNTMQWAVDAEL